MRRRGDVRAPACQENLERALHYDIFAVQQLHEQNARGHKRHAIDLKHSASAPRLLKVEAHWSVE